MFNRSINMLITLFLFVGLFSLSTIMSAAQPLQTNALNKITAPPPPSPVPTKPTQVQSTTTHPLNFSPTTLFSSPGIATMQGGQWVGNEHLYNIPTALGIVVELIAPKDKPLSISEEELKAKIITVFQAAHITARSPIAANNTPLPFFHLLVIVHPIEKGYVAYCSGRLFEAVQLSRVFLSQDINFQAITWEKQELLVVPSEQLREQMDQTASNIATAFVNLAKSYATESSPK